MKYITSSENLKVRMCGDSQEVYIANYVVKACLLGIPKGIHFMQRLLEALDNTLHFTDVAK